METNPDATALIESKVTAERLEMKIYIQTYKGLETNTGIDKSKHKGIVNILLFI